jgi:hypothetical protein
MAGFIEVVVMASLSLFMLLLMLHSRFHEAVFVGGVSLLLWLLFYGM